MNKGLIKDRVEKSLEDIISGNNVVGALIELAEASYDLGQENFFGPGWFILDDIRKMIRKAHKEKGNTNNGNV